MLPSCHRLRAQEVKEVLSKKSFTLKTSFLLCKIALRTDSPCKIAIVTTKKLSKRAVERHRQKRRLSASISTAYSLFPKNLHLVIFIKKSILTIEYKLIEEEISHLLQLIKKG